MIEFQKQFFLKIIKSVGFWFGMIWVIIFIPLTFSLYPFDPDPAMGLNHNSTIIYELLAVQVFTGIALIMFQSWGLIFTNIKTSSIFKNLRINGTITKTKFILMSLIPAFYLFAFVSIFFMGYVFIIVESGISNNPYVSAGSLWRDSNWGAIVLSFVTLFIITLGVSFFVSSISKKYRTYNSIMLVYVIILFFLGGSTTPIFILRGPDAVPAFKIISYFSLNSYSNFLFASSFNSSIHPIDLSSAENLANILVPTLCGTTLLGSGYYIMMKL